MVEVFISVVDFALGVEKSVVVSVCKDVTVLVTGFGVIVESWMLETVKVWMLVIRAGVIVDNPVTLGVNSSVVVVDWPGIVSVVETISFNV